MAYSQAMNGHYQTFSMSVVVVVVVVVLLLFCLFVGFFCLLLFVFFGWGCSDLHYWYPKIELEHIVSELHDF